MRMVETDWDLLLERLKTRDCTPFVGAAVNYGILPLGADIAKQWATRFGYPLDSISDLAKVAQFVATEKRDPEYAKRIVREDLAKPLKTFDFNDDNEPLNVLAKLPLPVYITTNYDDLLCSAIAHHGQRLNRKPVTELCKWFDPKARKPDLNPTVDAPLVYHLHGHCSVLDSIVLTEDDYLDFLVKMTRGIDKFLHPKIQEAMTKSILFIGYSMADTNFRVLFRFLRGNLPLSNQKTSVAVQLPMKDEDPHKKEKAEEYLERYFEGLKVQVYWGTAHEFMGELGRRWRKSSG